MEKQDLQLLKDSHDIVDYIERHVSLKKDGADYTGLCPFHEEKSPSFKVHPVKGIFKCFGCGKGGDVIDFVREMHRCTLPEAVAILNGATASQAANPIRETRRRPSKEPEWRHIVALVPCPDYTHYEHGQPNVIYPYKFPDGSLCGYVARFEFPDGKKETLPLIYAEKEGRYAWRYQGFVKRPLYGADRIANTKCPVVMVEGEKTADYLNSILKGSMVATTWIGGTGQIKKTEFTQIDGREVYFWPDNDEVGRKAMDYVSGQIQSDKKRYVTIPEGMPKGWDAADALLSSLAIINNAKPVTKKHNQDETYFTYLGFEKSDTLPVYVFYCKQSKSIFKFSASGMTKSNLMCMAPLSWWEMKFDGMKPAGVAMASDLMIATSYKVGIYSPKNIRGRGAWYDEGRIVVHAGNHLIVDGIEIELEDFKTKYIYEIGESFEFNTEDPLTKEEATRLLTMCKLLNWERNVNAELLAGWCVIAPVCGALGWRPHIWLTGPAGTGKSWVFRDIVRAMLGETSLSVQGATTEAGLRQSLGFDAKPVVFDEIDGNDKKSQDRIQEILELARSASADDTGKIVKGSASHTAKEFQIRSCFAFASIGVGADKGSDKRRITTLTLIVPENRAYKAERWKELERLHLDVMTDHFIKRMHARTVWLLPVILENTKVFTKAIAVALGAQASGDQLGPLLAGAYSLISDDLITIDSAIKLVGTHDWREETETEAIKDEQELANVLLQWVVRMDAFGERTVGELIAIVIDPHFDVTAIPNEHALAKLKRCGIHVTKDYKYVVFSGSNSEIKNRLKETRWAKNYSKILKRIQGSKDTMQRFGGAPERSVSIPIDGLFNHVESF